MCVPSSIYAKYAWNTPAFLPAPGVPATAWLRETNGPLTRRLQDGSVPMEKVASSSELPLALRKACLTCAETGS